jgi:hypothetical protein
MNATTKKRIAALVRLLGTSEKGERANAWRALGRAMQGVGLTWTDLGNMVESGGENLGDLQAIYDAALEEAVRRVQAQQSNGHISLPEPSEMAEFCHQSSRQLKDDKQRDFVSEMYVFTRRGMSLSRG